jgi:hypothetical protein
MTASNATNRGDLLNQSIFMFSVPLAGSQTNLVDYLSEFAVEIE